MRGLRRTSLAIVTLAAVADPVFAQADAPGTIACPKEIADIATCHSAKLPTGAYVLGAMPKSWNGSLIVFAHGGPGPIPPQRVLRHG
jgi:hypothetical protein